MQNGYVFFEEDGETTFGCDEGGSVVITQVFIPEDLDTATNRVVLTPDRRNVEALRAMADEMEQFLSYEDREWVILRGQGVGDQRGELDGTPNDNLRVEEEEEP